MPGNHIQTMFRHEPILLPAKRVQIDDVVALAATLRRSKLFAASKNIVAVERGF